eukprot:CAMPEP_0194292386 /NCGR_PEP_ID=MMETSP0169-20130528/45509_1 /TAXON_ID=218684 /ORGANISM="Corethron pennatum, Strain L29A3" /LENGTH=64 /DNA_ID=CAMNT_0039040547 /DNA_START=162 /DNA_END=356 /DNA_ORIENTATION=-
MPSGPNDPATPWAYVGNGGGDAAQLAASSFPLWMLQGTAMFETHTGGHAKKGLHADPGPEKTTR